jgi:hypothetical protein
MLPIPYNAPPAFAEAGGKGAPATFIPFANTDSTRTRLQPWILPPSISEKVSLRRNVFGVMRTCFLYDHYAIAICMLYDHYAIACYIA